MIELKNIGKVFPTADGKVEALADINLTIEGGEIFGVIGSSGAGKSTLVRCINLLEVPTSGQVLIDGEDVTKVSHKRLLEVRKNIGMIFQGFNLLEQRTVLKNVTYPLELTKTPRAEAEKRAKELLSLVGLSDKLSAYPSQLSGGQKQRVAIARALATAPKYLLCDEATSALDPVSTNAVLDLLKTVNETLGVTIVVITHEMKVVRKICDRVAVIENGKIVECGNVDDVLDDPVSESGKRLVLPELTSPVTGDDILSLVFKGTENWGTLAYRAQKETGNEFEIVFSELREKGGKTHGQAVVRCKLSKKIELIRFFQENGVIVKEETHGTIAD